MWWRENPNLVPSRCVWLQLLSISLWKHCHLQHILNTVSCCCLIIKLCPTLRDPMDQSMPGPPVFHCLPELVKFMFVTLVTLSSHLVLCRPLLLLPSHFPNIKVFSRESSLLMRWPSRWMFLQAILITFLEETFLKRENHLKVGRCFSGTLWLSP